MAALEVLYLRSKCDEVLHANREWVRTRYDPIACPTCHAVLPQHVGPFDVDVSEGPTGPLVGVWFPVAVTLLRTDLFGGLQAHMSEFHFGGATVNGARLPGYVSVFAGDSVRLPIFGDERSRYTSCPACGRDSDRLTRGALWFRRSDIGDRRVFSDSGGGALYVDRTLIESLPARLRRELVLTPIEVRD